MANKFGQPLSLLGLLFILLPVLIFLPDLISNLDVSHIETTKGESLSDGVSTAILFIPGYFLAVILLAIVVFIREDSTY